VATVASGETPGPDHWPTTRIEGDDIMRYLCLYKSDKPEGVPPTQDEMAKMGALIQEMTQAGVLLSTEGCLPSAKGARIRLKGGKVTVKDGPFTEAKELVGGFAIIQVQSKDEAVAWTKRFLETAGEGESEIRLLYEEPAMDTASKAGGASR
jgi:hypothetical protein